MLSDAFLQECLSSDQNIMKDRWINMGFEESELKPYKEPSKDVLDQGRIGKCAHARTARLFFSPNPFVWLTVLCFCKGSHLSTSTLICIKWPVDMLMSTWCGRMLFERKQKLECYILCCWHLSNVWVKLETAVNFRLWIIPLSPRRIKYVMPCPPTPKKRGGGGGAYNFQNKYM